MDIETEIEEMEQRLKALREKVAKKKKMYALSDEGKEIYFDTDYFSEGALTVQIKAYNPKVCYADFIALEHKLLSGGAVEGILDTERQMVGINGFYYPTDLLKEVKIKD